jgi:hypothetical protein
VRLIPLLAAAAVILACGERSSPTLQPDSPPVGAVGVSEAFPGTPETVAWVPQVVSPDAKGCLARVERSQFEEAVTVCLRAVRAYPTHPRIREALEIAQRETAAARWRAAIERASAPGARE